MADVLSYRDLALVRVPGTSDIADFHIGITPVTQTLWTDVMGPSPAPQLQPRRPVTHVSWMDITARGGFLDRVNAERAFPRLTFRLPTECEWEYAARGGRASGGFVFSGSDDIGEVAWFGYRFSAWRRLVCRVLGWKRGWKMVSRPPNWGKTHVHDVALKKANQLGVFDMTGNVWEWCEDMREDGERSLRGGCHQSWDIHCTNGFRYSQPADTRGKDIGFRLVLA